VTGQQPLEVFAGVLGEFNLSSQHFLIGGVDESQETRRGSCGTRSVALTRTAACIASIRAAAVLAGYRRGLLQ
jgi:hypothetical protein